MDKMLILFNPAIGSTQIEVNAVCDKSTWHKVNYIKVKTGLMNLLPDQVSLTTIRCLIKKSTFLRGTSKLKSKQTKVNTILSLGSLIKIKIGLQSL